MIATIDATLERLLGCRLWALVLKETRELLRNKYLIFLIVIPPVVQLLILGGALDPKVNNLSLATVDLDKTSHSRELVSALLDTTVFESESSFKSKKELQKKLSTGSYDVGIVIPEDFSRSFRLGETAPVEVLVDGADAYTAGIAENYTRRAISNFSPDGRGAKLNDSDLAHAGSLSEELEKEAVEPRITMLYNANQEGSWYFVPGVLGACLTLVATLVASALVLKERESGTIEQLLMTPASSWEIILSKIIPLLTFLMLDVLVAVLCSQVIFGMPVRGSFILLLATSALYALTGIGIGIFLGTLCTSQRQSQLSSLFFNIPLVLLSGTVVPLDTMPEALKLLSVINPLRYYTTIVRSLILKGADAQMLLVEIGILVVSATLILAISSYRLRRQLA